MIPIAFLIEVFNFPVVLMHPDERPNHPHYQTVLSLRGSVGIGILRPGLLDDNIWNIQGIVIPETQLQSWSTAI